MYLYVTLDLTLDLTLNLFLDLTLEPQCCLACFFRKETLLYIASLYPGV